MSLPRGVKSVSKSAIANDKKRCQKKTKKKPKDFNCETSVQCNRRLKMFPLRCLVFSLLLASTCALFPYGKMFKDDASAKTEKVSIRHIDSIHDRSKRDANTLPSSLVLAMERADGSRVLNLTLGRDPSHIKFYKNVGGKEEHVDIPRNQDIGIYSDTKGTGLMVERIAHDQYIVAGMYNDGNYIHDLYPAHRHRRNEVNGVVRDDHIIRRVTVDFEGKGYVDLEKKVEERTDFQALPRVKRDATVLRTIEILFYSDRGDWQNFLRIADGVAEDAMADMQTYYRLCEDCMNFIYNSLPSDEICIDIECKKLSVFMDDGAPSWVYSNEIDETNTYDASAILDDMDQTGDEDFDHWALFTGENIEADFGSGFESLAGLAYRGSLCTSQSVSVSENKMGVGTFTTVAHELGHSQNLQHDSLRGCSDTDGFLMAASFSYPDADMPGNYFSLSSCSIRDLKDFYDGDGLCTLTLDVPVDMFTPDLANQEGGQIYNADQQCDRITDGAFVCRGLMESRNSNTYCQQIACGFISGGSCTFITPMKGTSCGDQRWCINGSCVFDAAAPRRPENCLFGDQPGESCTLENCEEKGILCCGTCAPLDDSTTDAATTDAATTDAATTDGATTDAATTDAATTDAATTDAATTDGATTDGVTTDGATTDGATTDGATTDGATTDAATTDGATTDAATTDGATTDAATTDGATTYAATTDGATTDGPGGLQPGTVLSTSLYIIESCYHG